MPNLRSFALVALAPLIPLVACSAPADSNDDGEGDNGGSGATAGVAGTGQGGTPPQGGAGPTGGVQQGGAAGVATGGTGVGGTPPQGGTAGDAPTGGVGGAGVTGGVAGTAGSPAGTGGGGTGAGGTSGTAGTAGTAGTPVNCPAAPTGLIGFASQNGSTTGGGNGSPMTVTSASALASALEGTTARVVQVSGNISIGTLEIGSNKTLQGAAGGATLSGKILIDGATNVIVRNIRLNAASSEDDGFSIQGSSRIWIDHCEVYDAEDGNMDITDGSDYITVSWTKFRYSSTGDHNFSNLIAGDDSDSGNYRITFHHNWWANNVIERMPRVRFGDVHVFNNLYGIGTGAAVNDHCVRAAYQSNVRVESNYFDIVRTPHEIAEDQGNAVMTATTCANNTSVGSPAGCNIEYLSLNTGGNPASRGTAFTPPYTYMATPADCVKAHVTNAQTGAGPH